jgi:cholesterol transport system auxiliary component
VQVLGRNFGGRRATIVVALALFVAGCSGLPGGSKGAPPTFDLTAPQQFPPLRAPRGQMVVPDATALGVLDSDKIVVRPTESSIAALADAQWAERLPRLIQVRTIEAFENAHRLRVVGRPSDRLAADYQLLLDIRAFEIAVAEGPVAEVVIAAKIVGERSGRIVAGRIFQAKVPTSATQGPDAIAALDAAWGKVAVELVVWASRVI